MKTLKKKLDDSNHDKRTKELLGDALAFTIQKPEELFKSMSCKKDVAPNTAAFGMTINNINNIFKGHKVEIRKIIHDTQREFAKELKSHFGHWSKIAYDSGPRSLITDVSRTEVIKARELTLVDSKAFVGLQVIDTILWIFKRMSLGDDVSGVESILEVIIECGSFDGVTLGMHVSQVRSYDAMLPNPTSEQMEKIRQQISFLERGRWTQKNQIKES